MADFSTDLQQPQAAGASPVAPVSSGFKIPTIVADIVDVFNRGLVDKRKAEQEAFAEQIMGEYTRAKASINDAITQGAVRPEEGLARSRALFNKYSANFPQFVKGFKETDEAFIKSSVIGEAAEEEQAQQDMMRQLKKDAQNVGYTFPQGMSPEYEASQLQAFQATRQADEQFRRITARTSEARSQSAEERASTLYNSKMQAEGVLKTLAQEHYQPASFFVRDISARAKKGESPETLALDVQQYFNNIEAGIVQASALNPELGTSFKGLFDGMRQMATDAASGKLDAESSDNRLKEVKNKLQLIALGLPENQAIYASTAIAGGNLIVNDVERNRAADKLFKMSAAEGGLVPLDDIIAKPEFGEKFSDVLKDRIRNLNTNAYTDKPKAQQELSTAVNNLNAGVAEVNLAKVTPQQLTSMASFYASPEYAQMVKTGAVDLQTAARAKDVLSLGYERTITRGVEQKLQSTFQFSGGNRPARTVADIVDVKFNGAGVDFVTKDQGYLSPVDRQDQQQFLREMKASKDAVNQLIHIGAHMEGHQDYSGYWERNKHIIMPSYYPDPNRLKLKQVVDGYEYIGGPPASQSSWKKVEVANE